MQDRFRFRVWNKKNKEMIYNAEIAYDGMSYNTSWQIGKNTNDGWVDCFGYYLDYPEDYDIMQCTGLKDKNGKLIYEGDILEDPVHKFKVGWNEYSFVISGASKKGEEKQVYFFPLLARTFKVIGNIYENKSLLESEV